MKNINCDEIFNEYNLYFKMVNLKPSTKLNLDSAIKQPSSSP